MKNISLNILTYDRIFPNLYSGTDNDWFKNLTDEGDERIYKCLPIQISLKDDYFSSEIERRVKERYKDSPQLYPCIFYMDIKSFVKWFEQYKPHQKAGWVTTKVGWEWKYKGIIPKKDTVYPSLIGKHFSNAETKDLVFLQYTDKEDNFLWLYNFILDNNLMTDKGYIWYYIY